MAFKIGQKVNPKGFLRALADGKCIMTALFETFHLHDSGAEFWTGTRWTATQLPAGLSGTIVADPSAPEPEPDYPLDWQAADDIIQRGGEVASEYSEVHARELENALRDGVVVTRWAGLTRWGPSVTFSNGHITAEGGRRFRVVKEPPEPPLPDDEGGRWEFCRVWRGKNSPYYLKFSRHGDSWRVHKAVSLPGYTPWCFGYWDGTAWQWWVHSVMYMSKDGHLMPSPLPGYKRVEATWIRFHKEVEG
jgi:hypothetical protein